GCTKWVYQADGPVRSAMPVAPLAGGKHAVMFGDQTGWFYALEAESGKQLWKVKPESHEATKLTGSPVVHDGIVYVPTASWEEGRPQNASYQCCTFRGSVVAYKIADGTQVWKTYMIPDPPAADGKQVDGHAELAPSGIGIWSAPTIDTKRGRLYVTTGNTYSGASPNSDAVVALELATGKILWASQTLANDTFNGGCFQRGGCAGPDADFGASPILVEGAGGKSLLLAGQKSGMVYAFDADHEGALVWKQRVGKGGINGGVQFGMAADAVNVYAAVSDVGRVARAQKGKVDARPSGVDPNVGGGLTALRIRDGVKAWFAPPAKCDPARPMCSPAQPAAVAAMPGVVFAGNVDGYLRAYSTRDGKVLWEFDTNKDWTTEGKVVNGVKTRGGSIDGAGPVIAGGMVFVSSGYARNGAQGGNALLAFGID
ncbi:MAG: PQQ-binding-like beta-propeller repeat protein, partial [Acidobacteriota bacterium]